ncbi:MAG: malate synthase G [Planctomycetota bacterium]|jgi:malate synthase
MYASLRKRLTIDDWTAVGNLQVEPAFYDFVEEELLPAIDMDAGAFWAGLEKIVDDLTPLNRKLLRKRDELQRQIDQWHKEGQSGERGRGDYIAFLRKIGYLQEEGAPFEISTKDVDSEIAAVAAPQLVVPLSNARFALNAANARWGSLYDALYGSDVIAESDGLHRGNTYNPKRGDAVIGYAAQFLDRTLPLKNGSHSDVSSYRVETVWRKAECIAMLNDGSETRLQNAWQFIAYSGREAKRSLLFRNNGLHIEIQIDPDHPVGRKATANVSDIILEAAVTTIQDCEDSVAAVDAGDKVNVYRNWLELMQGTLQAYFSKGGKLQHRSLNPDRNFIGRDGSVVTLPGRSLMLVRNVGHLMTTNAVIDRNGDEIFEGILDAIITTACALCDIRHDNSLRNSREGSIYIVKPKMHGPQEAQFTVALLTRVEDMFGLEPDTIKIGVMDEERRTTINLKECIRVVHKRLAFINTGFLDRTGDEIHTSMHAGPMLPKEKIKQQPWLDAYEDRNVDTGIRCGLPGRAQIGKGMWPMPDEMKEMVHAKVGHPAAGANCAWVPSPTAATLHALHYHAIDVSKRQIEIADRSPASLEDILTPPLADPADLTPEIIQAELDNNIQGILGYVVRWIDQGIGCSKVPDINDVGLMEDRATLRISSQHIANWLLHGVCTEDQVRETFRRMAFVVDRQNADDLLYERMSRNPDGSIAFRAACDLVFKGCDQPNGYTEPLLHAYRKQQKMPAPIRIFSPA